MSEGALSILSISPAAVGRPLLAAALALALMAAPVRAEEHGHGKEAAKEAAPETYVVLDLFSEAFDASIAGIGVKIAELKPKVENINDLYAHGETHKAFAQALGISTELVVLGFCIETFGIADTFMSALSFGGNWVWQIAQSTAGVMASTKVALLAGDKVEEATEENYDHAHHTEARARANNHNTLADATR